MFLWKKERPRTLTSSESSTSFVLKGEYGMPANELNHGWYSMAYAPGHLQMSILSACRYILTKGAQFGADWLIYEGSPETHHAVACLRIVDPSHPIDPVLLAGFCRCSFSARKDVLLASWDGQLNAPHFLTLRPKKCLRSSQFQATCTEDFFFRQIGAH